MRRACSRYTVRSRSNSAVWRASSRCCSSRSARSARHSGQSVSRGSVDPRRHSAHRRREQAAQGVEQRSQQGTRQRSQARTSANLSRGWAQLWHLLSVSSTNSSIVPCSSSRSSWRLRKCTTPWLSLLSTRLMMRLILRFPQTPASGRTAPCPPAGHRAHQRAGAFPGQLLAPPPARIHPTPHRRTRDQ